MGSASLRLVLRRSAGCLQVLFFSELGQRVNHLLRLPTPCVVIGERAAEMLTAEHGL